MVVRFLYHFKAGPAGGRPRRPSAAGNDTAATGEPGLTLYFRATTTQAFQAPLIG